MINSKTLEKLQYADILRQISAFAVSAVAKQKVLNLLPADTFASAQALLEESRQAFDLFRFEISFDLSVDDVSEACALAKIGSCLSMGQLLKIMRTLKTARSLQGALFADYGVDISALQSRAYALYCDRQLEEDIDFAIISEEEMNDKASDDLFAIRKKIKGINADIKQKLQSYTKNSEVSKYLQDSIVTLRGDRYVIPVKQEYRSFVSGIVHDQSSTGATLFIEPMAIVQLNNALREATLEEKAEIQRILQAFTDRISPVAERIALSENTISDIDVIFSKTKYAIENKCTLPLHTGRAPVQLVNDIITDQIGILGDDREIFAHVETLQHTVQHRRLDHQTQNRKQTNSRPIGNPCKQRDHKIRNNQRSPDVHAGVLFQNHRDNIRPASRRFNVKQNCASNCRQTNRKNQLHQRLISQRLGHRNKVVQQLQHCRHQNRRIGSLRAKSLAENQKSNHQQEHVQKSYKVTRTEMREEFRQYNRDTRNASG